MRNDFSDCDCVPPRLVEWDSDANMMTDMSELGTDKLAHRGLYKNGFHLIFNSREYQALDHDVKMKMMWEQLTKVKKVKC